MTIETMKELQKRQRDERAALKRKQAIVNAQPESVRARVRFVQDCTKSLGVYWVSYEAKDAADAISIARAYPAPFEVTCNKSACTSIAPAQYQGKQYRDEANERWRVPDCVMIEQHGGKGFYSAKLIFWTEGVRVAVEFPLEPKLRDCKYWTGGEFGRAGEWVAQFGRITGHNEVTRFSGGSPDSFNNVYAFAGVDEVARALFVHPQQQDAQP
jgi:hypothetical protein